MTIFRSETYRALEENRAKLAEIETEHATAAEALKAEIEVLEAAERERLVSVKRKELGSRVQSARTRAAAAVRVARQIEVEAAALSKSWGMLQDEADALKALGAPFDIHDLGDLIGDEFRRAASEGHFALPGVIPGSVEPEPLSDTIEALGKEAVEAFMDRLLAREA